jgi:hypothetical protein
MQRAALYTSALIFAAGAVGYGLRLVRGFEIVIGGVVVPVWCALSCRTLTPPAEKPLPRERLDKFEKPV